MKPPAWSFSSLNAFGTCPRQYHAVKILKTVAETKGEATLWGTRFHEVAEHYLKGEQELPAEFEQFREYLDQFLAMPGTLSVELELGVNKRLEPCDFLDPDVWCRGIVDVLVRNDGVAYVGDHKTGKRKPNSKQLKLFAALVFAHYPDVHTCRTAFHWIKTDEVDKVTFNRLQVLEMWETFVPELKQFLEAFKTDTFTPRPSGLCKKHCSVSDCEYCGIGSY